MHLLNQRLNQRFNNNPFMTKQLRKAIMHRSRLKNVFNKVAHKKHGIAIKNRAISV